jgi:hypothetical protein
LIKEGHAGALGLIGVSNKPEIKFKDLKIKQKKVKLGNAIEFEFEIHSSSGKAQKLVVDYIVHFMESNSATAPKVFKLKTVELPSRAEMSFTKSHKVRKITTRQYYPGLHRLEIQVNGTVVPESSGAWFYD